MFELAREHAQPSVVAVIFYRKQPFNDNQNLGKYFFLSTFEQIVELVAQHVFRTQITESFGRSTFPHLPSSTFVVSDKETGLKCVMNILQLMHFELTWKSEFHFCINCIARQSFTSLQSQFIFSTLLISIYSSRQNLVELSVLSCTPDKDI